MTISYSATCYTSSSNTTETTYAGVIDVNFIKSTYTTYKYDPSKQSGSNSTVNDMELQNFVSNLRGSGTITLELIAGHISGNYGTLYSETQYPRVTLVVSNGSVVTISYNFSIDWESSYYYPNRINVTVT